MQNSISKFFNEYIRNYGCSIKINGIDNRGFFKEVDDREKGYDNKYLFTELGKVRQGDIIECLENNWIVIDKDSNIGQTYDKCVIARALHNIKIYINNTLHEFPAIIQTQRQGIDEGKYINIADGKIMLITQDNSVTRKIGYDKRIIKMQNVWNVVGFTNENEGLRYIYCKKGQFNPSSDDLENEIADRWLHETKHEYSIDITEDNIQLKEGETKQLIVNVTDTVNNKTITVKKPTLIYTSLNNNIVTVDDKGLTKAISEGGTTIKVTFENIEKIINVKVVEGSKVQLEIIGTDKMALNRTKTYTSNIPVVWSVENVEVNGEIEKVKYATITESTDTTCTIKTTDKWIFNDGRSRYFNLIAISEDNSSIVVIKKIRVTPY
ncbi:Ig-like domain-containing protein [Clostridium brassicae]|uniref:Ig-like domain-containing protein n=1 Tax=Clostridium brassicae TaxID=2999072 RepID=A0ABT4D7L8_9CLOT|nr:Ig-like domain-containing protein [Clostridium brassicae]MCY6958273.1 Ig-like domain-containing protein [Clostridium brassicae]